MKFKENLRIIWAITAKDITDAIKNKIVQGVFIGVAFLMFSSQALSLLMGFKDEPTAHFWDQGKSVVVKDIVRSRKLNFHPRDDVIDLKDAVSQSAEPVVGIVIPVDFDERVSVGSSIQAKAYQAHWTKPDAVAEIVGYFEENLSLKTGIAIQINVEDHKIYPPAEGLGYPMMIAFGMVIGVMTVGLILTPYLIVDEKESHTLEALLISPARTMHLLIGKSVVGQSYSLIASSLIFILSWRWIVHWDIIFLAIILGGLSAVSVGLLIGVLVDTPTNVNMFVGLLLAVFLMPMYLWTSLAPKLSPFVQSAISALPSIAMYKLVRQSFTESPTLSMLWVNIVILLTWTLLISGLVAWRVRRLDR